VSGAFIGRLFPNQSYEMTAQHSDFHHAQEQVKTYVRLILDVCEEEKERDEGKFKSVCTNVLDKLWDSIFFPLVGVDDDDEDDEGETETAGEGEGEGETAGVDTAAGNDVHRRWVRVRGVERSAVRTLVSDALSRGSSPRVDANVRSRRRVRNADDDGVGANEDRGAARTVARG